MVNYVWSGIRAYLTNRIQFVTINDQTSTFLPIASVVPQGSQWGPLVVHYLH